MKSILNISEAFSIALHSAAVLASRGGKERFTSRDISSMLGVSEAHLSKVMRRMVRAGVLESARGPGGGYSLGRPARDITLLDIFEVVEGPLNLGDCLIGKRVCSGSGCVFDGLIGKVNGQFKDYLEGTTLEEIGGLLGG